MTAELRTHAAVERAEAERERIERKVAAFEAFGDRVDGISVGLLLVRHPISRPADSVSETT